ncbi:MAG: hypothetical protein AAFN05_17430, partial [Pseudomonadota bacterium]
MLVGSRQAERRGLVGRAEPAAVCLTEPEEGDHAVEGLGLFGEVRGGRVGLFGRGGVALHDLIEVADRLVDLVDADLLLAQFAPLPSLCPSFSAAVPIGNNRSLTKAPNMR